MSNQETEGLPGHIGVIMDGNGRWAAKRGLPRKAGHRKGAEAFQRLCKSCYDLGIPYLTVYAFSTENWSRPKEEVDSVMQLLRDYLKEGQRQSRQDARVRFIGDRTPLAADIREMMGEAEAESAGNHGFQVNIAVNYGGREELTRAVWQLAKRWAEQLAQNGREMSAQGVSETLRQDAARVSAAGALETMASMREQLSRCLYTAGMPDVDLLIRTGGEQRISNFLLWQGAYAELVFLDVLWPDFGEKDLEEALRQYRSRHRRFGGL